jgi:hypothetical protein
MSTSAGARIDASRSIADRKRRRVLYQVMIFAALLGLVGYGFSRFVLSPAQSSSGVPQFVGALGLINSVEGKEALTEINKLHGTGISLTSAYIADYEGRYGGTHMKVWAGEAGSPDAAEALITQMVNGINRGGSPFSSPKKVKIAGHEVWQADGAGGSFFFYRSGDPSDRVVWLTINGGGDPLSLVESALRTF